MIQFPTTLKMMYWKYIAEDIATSADFICCHRLQTIIQQCKISLTKALLGLNLRAPSNATAAVQFQRLIRKLHFQFPAEKCFSHRFTAKEQCPLQKSLGLISDYVESCCSVAKNHPKTLILHRIFRIKWNIDDQVYLLSCPLLEHLSSSPC